MTALHLRGVFLPEEEQRDAWIVDGRLTFEPVSGADTIADGGWVLPGFVDAHCHIGVTTEGWADEDEQVEQAVLDRDAGALLLRDAGAPVDNTGVQRRRGPAPAGAGRAPHRPAAPLHPRPGRRGGTARTWWPRWSGRPAAATAGSSWPRTGSTARSASCCRSGRTTCWPPRSAGPTSSASGWPRTPSASRRCPGWSTAGIDSIEHGTGITADLLDEIARRQIAVVPTLINVDTFPAIADSAAGEVPGLRRAHARAVRAAPGSGSGTPSRPACRSTPAPTPAARCRTG